MARLLLGRRLEGVRSDSFEVHPPRRRYALFAPIRDRRRLHLAQAGDGGGSAKRVDDFGVGVLGIHDAIIRLALFLVKAHLTSARGMPKSVPLRIAE